MKGKVLRFTEYKKVLGAQKGKKILVGGCFDVLHIGHVRYLEAAKNEGDVVIVALEGDQFIREQKGREPFHTHAERAELLIALKHVDFVILLPFLSSFKDYLELVENVKPDIIAITEGDTQIHNKEKQAKKIDGRVKIVIPKKENTSSTDMLDHFK